MSGTVEIVGKSDQDGPEDNGNLKVTIEFNPSKKRIERIHFSRDQVDNWEFILAILGMAQLYVQDVREMAKAEARMKQMQERAMAQQLRMGR